MKSNHSFGYFDDSNREYIITDPRTPRKWINYIGDMRFGGFVDNTGGALLCKGDPGLNRITFYVTQLPSSSFKGETLYLRTHISGKYEIHSPWFVPGLKPLDEYACHIGLGYTRLVTKVGAIKTDTTIIVPSDAPCELRKIKITNCGVDAIDLDIIPAVEYSHFDALKQLTNADWVPQTMQSKVYRLPDGKVIAKQAAFMMNGYQENYFTASLPVDSFETERAKFLGDHDYGSWASPLSLMHHSLSNSKALNGENIAAFLIPLKDLLPGETRTLILQLGQVESVEENLVEIIARLDESYFNRALEQNQVYWQNYMEKLQVETPDAQLNSMLNIHNPRQCQTTKTWSRYLSLYQLGYGSRGMGFRDSSQDVMAVMHAIPEEAKELLISLLSVQRPDGSAYHQFYPLSGEASEGDSLEYPDRPHYYCDDHLWGVMAVCQYIKETGDVAFLDMILPYRLPKHAMEKQPTGTVLDHLHRALAFTHSNTGSHGIPLLGFADWNDTVNLPLGAESFLAACLFGRALRDMIELMSFLKMDDRVRLYEEWYAVAANNFKKYAWDGEWFRSYYDSEGNPLGSKVNSAGQIFAYSQAWPILAGFADQGQARTALDSLNQKLNTKHGIKLSAPGFKQYDPAIGGITTYPPGAKENGGIFLHVNPWVIIAETLMGNGDRAYQYYSQINPAAKNDLLNVYEVEPYVYAQNILGDEHPKFGMGRNSWLSGTASWMYQAGTQYILGIKPEYNGLKIDPCIPCAWEHYKVKRCFRGTWYEIQVENPDRVNRGVGEVFLDGQLLSDNLLPVFDDGDIHRVKVMLRSDLK